MKFIGEHCCLSPSQFHWKYRAWKKISIAIKTISLIPCFPGYFGISVTGLTSKEESNLFTKKHHVESIKSIFFCSSSSRRKGKGWNWQRKEREEKWTCTNLVVLYQNSDNNIFERVIFNVRLFRKYGNRWISGRGNSNRLFNSRRRAIHCGEEPCLRNIFVCGSICGIYLTGIDRESEIKEKKGREKEKLERKWRAQRVGKDLFFFLLLFHGTDCPVDIPPLSIYRYYVITSHKSFDRRNSFAFFLFQRFIHLKNLKKFFLRILF